MTCKDFLRSFSDYRDGLVPEPSLRDVEAHMEACPTCRQYARVVEAGMKVLRSEPPMELAEDFDQRLRHRLYHVDEEVALLGHANSGATALAVLSIALVLTAVAWSPMLRPSAPMVELAPIVVSDPPAPLRLRPARAYPFGPSRTRVPRERARGLWDDAHTLLFEYSPISQRYRERTPLRRAGLDQD